MNINNVSQREVLDYKQFIQKVHDYNYKPLSPANQSEGGLEKSGLSKIKREPRYDFVGYADAVFGNQSKIDSPGFRFNTGQPGNIMMDAGAMGSVFNMDASESLQEPIDHHKLKRLKDF